MLPLIKILLWLTPREFRGRYGGELLAFYEERLRGTRGLRVLTGLGIAALLFYVSGYYYQLDVTLLVKSGVLAATGAVLLAARWLMLNFIMPQEDAGRA